MNNNDLSLFENALLNALPFCDNELKPVTEMFSYSLKGGGKRVRPMLCMAFARACGGRAENAIGLALAVEFVHTYSLIHDDLPCMDNDDERRGKPSSHIKFGEANALLAGDGLLTHAFEQIEQGVFRGELSAVQGIKAVGVLSRLAGANGMLGGQYLDLYYENKTAGPEVLYKMDALKTSALLKAACILGCIAANADDEKIKAASEFAEALGIAFQITDDLLEIKEGEPSTDEKKHKLTYVSALGENGARQQAVYYTEQALKALTVFGERAEPLKAAATELLNRKK